MRATFVNQSIACSMRCGKCFRAFAKDTRSPANGGRRAVGAQIGLPPMEEPGRKHPTHHPFVERHNEPIIIFLTVCSKDRKRIFASQDVRVALENVWSDAKTWLVGQY